MVRHDSLRLVVGLLKNREAAIEEEGRGAADIKNGRVLDASLRLLLPLVLRIDCGSLFHLF